LIKKAIIPAAGYGTRSLPVTKVVPKEMFPIVNKTAIHYIVEEAVSAGIEEILIIVSRNKEAIINYFDRSIELEIFLKENNKDKYLNKLELPNVHLQYVRQPYARGLGDALRLGKNFVGNEPFAVLLPDEILLSSKKSALEQLIDVYKERQGNILALKEMAVSELHRYGVISGKQEVEGLHTIDGIIEKPCGNPPSNFAVIGRYVLQPTIFDSLQTLTPGAGGEIQLTDAIKEDISLHNTCGVEVNAERYDIAKDSNYLALLNRLSSL
jgi:UTP--glucose-1-phosphate uridylyltransferase